MVIARRRLRSGRSYRAIHHTDFGELGVIFSYTFGNASRTAAMLVLTGPGFFGMDISLAEFSSAHHRIDRS